ncbi:MAG: hypothetical protein ACK5LE_01395 [Alphaproteobacteria bacterium]
MRKIFAIMGLIFLSACVSGAVSYNTDYDLTGVHWEHPDYYTGGDYYRHIHRHMDNHNHNHGYIHHTHSHSHGNITHSHSHFHQPMPGGGLGGHHGGHPAGHHGGRR